MNKPIDLRTFRTLTGPARKEAMRSYLAQQGIVFALDPHSLRMSDQCLLSDMAKAVSWRKGINSPMSLGLAFYVYLSRDVGRKVETVRRAGGRWNNDGVAR